MTKQGTGCPREGWEGVGGPPPPSLVCPCPCFATLYWRVANVVIFLVFNVTVGWLEEGVTHDISHHSNSVKQNGKVLPRSLESVDHTWVVRATRKGCWEK